MSRIPSDVGPNISGVLKAGNGYLDSDFSGAYYPETAKYNHGGTNFDNAPKNPSFDASRSDSVYGESATVQPESVRLIPCIKL